MQPMRTTIQVSALFIGVAAALVAHDAHALGPLDLEIGARGGFGTTPGGGSGANALGAGIGGRAGVAIIGLYGGLSGMYYFGESKNIPLPLIGSVSESLSSVLLGVEGGYGSKLGPLTLRGTVGVGNLATSVSYSGVPAGANVPNTTYNGLYIEPGVTALIGLGIWFVGADANVLILPNGTGLTGDTSLDGSFTVHGQLGVKF
jgi:hypothetical protein